jgi:hypothetical protein
MRSNPRGGANELDELFDLVHALRNAYGDEVVHRVASVIDRQETPEVLQARITRELEHAASDHAERLLAQWSTTIEVADAWLSVMGQPLTELVVVVVDPLCPRLPEAADAFPDGASLQPRELVADLLAETAPHTAHVLDHPSSPGAQVVVAFTFGRILTCEREISPFGSA